MRTIASIVTTCKGRLDHLRFTLPLMCAQQVPFAFEVIVVDYGDPDGAFDWCHRLADQRVRAVRVVAGTDYFNLSRARNCGATISEGMIVCFVDADMFLHPAWLHRVSEPLLAGSAVLVAPEDDGTGAHGTCGVLRSVYCGVRGFDETLQGWGYEDIDFCERCAGQGPVKSFPPTFVRQIPHGDDLRTRYYAEDIRTSHRSNRRLVASRVGPVNPNGFGQMS